MSEMKNNITLEIGKVYNGFKLDSIKEIPELEGAMYVFSHEKSGAELIWTARPDNNKTFAIAFRTTPEDDTGVFHILEHSVLCGSDKYPVKDPFVRMLQTSMQTFLNAMTYPDKTVYPVASRNDKDFRNLMSIYLDAVFHPAFLSNPNIFYQEGRHYELHDKADIPSVQGVVYSEMQGAFADPDTEVETAVGRELYPDTCYHYVSGGHPASIPDLTYEQFIDTYRRYYAAYNSIVLLDGDMDILDVMSFIDSEYLGKFENNGLKIKIDYQQEIPAKVSTYNYGIGDNENPDGKDMLVFAKLFGGHENPAKGIAMDILSRYLCGSNESPLQRAILDSGLCEDVGLYVQNDFLQPQILLQLKNTRAKDFDALRRVVFDTVKKIAADGLDKSELTAHYNQLAFSLKDKSANYGLEVIIRILTARLYGFKPETYLENTQYLEEIKKGIEGDYFEKLLLESFAEESFNEIRMVAKPGLHTENQMKFSEKMEQFGATLTDSDKEEMIKTCEKLVEWQATPDSEEAVATLPLLTMEDVSPDIETVEYTEKNIDGVKILELPTLNKYITYMRVYFPVPKSLENEFYTLSLMTNLFTNLPTKQHSVKELQKEINSNLGGIFFDILPVKNENAPDTCSVQLVVSCSVLHENIDHVYRLIREIVTETLFDDTAKIQESVLQLKIGLKQSLSSNGHIFAMTNALSSVNPEDAIKEESSGYSSYKMLEKLADNFDSEKDAVKSNLQKVQKSLFCRDNVVFGISGNIDTDKIKDFVNSLPVSEDNCYEICPSKKTTEGFIEIPGDVGYASTAYNLNLLGYDYSGSVAVGAKLLTFDYLWNVIRVQNGAYGTGLVIRDNGDAAFYSYRDPSTDNSLKVYEQAGEYLKQAAKAIGDLDSLKIGTLCDIDPLLTAFQQCKLCCDSYFTKHGGDFRRKLVKEVIETTPEQLSEFADVLNKITDKKNSCIVGGKK